MENFNRFQLPRVTALLQRQLAHFQKLLSAQATKAQLPLPLSDYIFSRKDLADFMLSSISSTRRWEKQGKIKSEHFDRLLCWHIPTLYESISKDDHIQNFMVRKIHEQNCRSKSKPKKAGEIRYSLFVKKGLLFIDFRFKNRRNTIVCSQELYNNDAQIKSLIHDIISIRRSVNPLKKFVL